MRTSVRKITFTAVLATFSLIAFMLEGLMPTIFIPGARIGFSNLFILLALILCGKSSAICVFIIKVVLGSVFSGNISALLYSFPSGAISLTVEILLVYYANKRLSLPAISALSAVLNGSVQNVVFILVTKTPMLIIYLPYIALISLVSGVLIGVICQLIIKVFPLSILEKPLYKGE